MTVVVRVAEPTHENAIKDLLNELARIGSDQAISDGFVDAFKALLMEQRGRILIAEEEGVVLGMASVSYNLAMRYGGEYCQLEELIVAEQARGKNVGGLLVLQTIADAQARGCVEYGLYLVEHTEHNRGFYEKYGLKPVGTEMRRTLER